MPRARLPACPAHAVRRYALPRAEVSRTSFRPQDWRAAGGSSRSLQHDRERTYGRAGRANERKRRADEEELIDQFRCKPFDIQVLDDVDAVLEKHRAMTRVDVWAH